MWKHLLAILLLTSTVVGVAHFHRDNAGPDAEFRCHLPDIKCDGCRSAITQELTEESGIRAVRFEGAERKDLVITHRANRTVESLRTSLARIGYPPEVLAGDPTKAVSHEKCVCPMERAKTAQP